MGWVSKLATWRSPSSHIEHLELDGVFFPDGYSGNDKTKATLKLWRKHG